MISNLRFAGYLHLHVATYIQPITAFLATPTSPHISSCCTRNTPLSINPLLPIPYTAQVRYLIHIKTKNYSHGGTVYLELNLEIVLGVLQLCCSLCSPEGVPAATWLSYPDRRTKETTTTYYNFNNRLLYCCASSNTGGTSSGKRACHHSSFKHQCIRSPMCDVPRQNVEKQMDLNMLRHSDARHKGSSSTLRTPSKKYGSTGYDILYCMKLNKLKGDATIAVLHIQVCHWSGQYEYKLVNHVKLKQMRPPAMAPPMHIGAYMTLQLLTCLF